ELAGTAPYMAPEQWGGAPLTAACDWYSVGVMLFEALTGSRPFSGKPSDVLREKLSGEAPAPSLLKAAVAEDFDTLCRDLLRRDPAERPSGAEILTRLGARAPRGAEAPAAKSEDAGDELVGRERHLALLREAFASVQGGATVTTHVHGPSGTGKTAVVDRFLATLDGDGEPVILRGRCYEQESVPYKALDSLVDALTDHLQSLDAEEVSQLIPVQAAVLARVFPVLQRVAAIAQAPTSGVRGSDPRELRRAAVSALRELLTRMGQRRDLVLAIDDLQWGDLDSAVVLGDLLAPPDPPRLMLMLAYRSEYVERSACLAALHRTKGGTEPSQRRLDVPLTPLSQPESEELARRLLKPASVAGFANTSRVARESGGNPYFIYELSRHLDLSAGPDVRGGGSPVELDEVLWARVQRLPLSARELLGVIAVAAQPVALRHLFEIASDSADVQNALAQLRAGHLIRGTGSHLDDYVESYHDRVRESVATRLPPDVASRYHASLARTFEAAGNIDAETIAGHFLGAGDPSRAGEYYARAAHAAAAALAFDRAATLYRQALQGRTLDAAEHTALQRELGHALANAGRGNEAAQAYEAAVTTAPLAEHFELERLAAAHYCFSGRIREGRVIFRRLLAGAGLTLPSSPVRILTSLLTRRARLRLRGVGYVERPESAVPAAALRRIDLLWSVAAGLSLPDALGVASLQTEGLLLALKAGEPYRVARALAFEAFMTSVDGTKSARRARELMDKADALATRIGDPHAQAVVLLMKELIALNQARFEDVVPLGDAAEAAFLSRCSGAWWEIALARTEIAWSLWHQAKCQLLRQRTAEMLTDAIQRGDLFLVTNLRSVITPFLYLLDDDPDAAMRESG
ncbi:MAG: AAA family ATPase, partial [Acetobacteraceae bacterium]